MRYLVTFSYDGNNYYGYQKQKTKITVQGEIEKNISQILNTPTKLSASGRTDSSVHAINQKAHFDTSITLNEGKFLYSLNLLLNDDIYIKSIEKVNSDFHARYSIKKKEYEYRINVGEYNVFERNYVFQYNKPLNIDLMKEVLNHIEGTHNFKTFAKVEKDIDFIRTIYEANIRKENDIIYINFIGNGFLRYMVRNIVGLLIEVGNGKKNINDVTAIINSQDRKKAGMTASPIGLYLKNVEY